MIKSVIIVNSTGRTRLAKFYDAYSNDKKQTIINWIFKNISKLGENCCNFLDGPYGKIVFRQYATLYIIFVIDDAESELGVLDLIQVFVEVLDKCFENVCELDLIFNPEKAYNLLDEIVLGGMVAETNIGEIWSAINTVNAYEKKKG
jgi:AP-3 complex subunit sigma